MTEQDPWSETSAGVRVHDPRLRAGDKDRDAVAETLRVQHAEGRLDLKELQSRIDRCYEAKTFGELEQLLVDLPGEPSAQPRPGWPLGQRSRLISLAAVIVTLAAISAVTGRHVMWLAIPAIFFAIRLARAGYQPRPWRYTESDTTGAP